MRADQEKSSLVNVTVCPSDTAGCGSYRLIWPAEALQKEGKEIRITKRPRILVDRGNPPAVKDVFIPDTDVMVFQRPGSYQIAQIIPILQDQGIKVVIDMDDDLSCIHPKNPAHKYYDPTHSPNRNWQWAAKACEMADLVTVTTPALAERYGNHGQVAVLPNCVPARYTRLSVPPNDGITVGWAGYVGTHPEDLQITHGAINEAVVSQGARFYALGDKNALTNLGIRNRYPHTWLEAVALSNFPEFVSQLDIGIVPLARTPFNAAKSWLKGLEYAALGVAPVVSPTPDNMRLVEAGAAYVARSPKGWLDAVKTLIRNEEERVSLAKRAREFAADWTIEANTWRWWEAWSQT